MMILPVLLACGGKNTEPATPSVPETPAAPPIAEAGGTSGETEVVTSSSGSLAAPTARFAPSATGFALAFHRGAPDGNLVVSGVSAYMALSMLGEGTVGSTRERFETVLGGPLDATWHVDNERALAGMLQTPGVKLGTANGLWVDQGESLEPGFVATVGEHYGARPAKLPFSSDPEAAAATIDAWTQENTQGMIESLFTPAQLADAVFALANAVAFDGQWLVPFEADATRPHSFQTPGGPVEVPMMHRNEKTPWMQGEGFQAVSLPYQGESTRLLLLLPDAGTSLESLEKGLSHETLVRVANIRGARPVDLLLPRLELTQEHDLRTLLPDLQLDKGDYSGIAPQIAIGAALQKTFLQIDEEGTKAAAVTGVVGTRSLPPPPIDVHFDRPFFFALWHDGNQVPLFTGRVEDPRG